MRYGLSFKNHGRWTTPTQKFVFSATEVKQLSGLPRRANIYRHLANVAEYAGKMRKQPVRVIVQN